MERSDLIETIKQSILDNGETLPEGLLITEDTRISELELSSISFVELIFSIEEAFDINLEINAANPIHTVGEFIQCIESEIQKK